MGGNALKNVETRRYAAAEYLEIAEKTIGNMYWIDSENTCTKAIAIEAYRNKDSFGDLDILYTTKNDHPFTVDEIREQFEPDEIIRNGDVISFNVKQLQVDLIHTKWSEFNYAKNYFAWNDQGNLVGRIAKKHGLKHGHDGLFLPVRDGDQVFAEILITLDYSKALEFLGFDIYRYARGFDELVDVFDWVAANPFYNPDFYKLENLNHVAKIRDRKRSTYNSFLEYGKNIENTGKQFWNPVKDRTYYMEQIFDAFPEAKQQYHDVMMELAANRYLRTRFNGNIVRDLTGLEGKELGSFMKELKSKFWFSSASIVMQSDAQIQTRILKEFENFKNSN